MSKKQFSDSGTKTGYYGYSSESRNVSDSKKSQKSKSKGGTAFGVVLAILQLIVSVFFIGLLLYKNFAFITLPILIGIIAALVILLGVVIFMQKGSLKAKRAAKVISVIVIIIVLLLTYLISPLQRMSGKKVSTDPFVVFVSANDTFGGLDNETIGRSDTNILAVVNPKTHTVLIISTPRDYYVPIQAKSVAPESYDKLTHVGLYGNGVAYDSEGNDLSASEWQWGFETNWHPGCNALMDTLQHLYSFEIPENRYHYVKLNFTGFANLIDALGGITVDVDIPFKSKTYASYEEDDKKRKTYVYKKGEMEMDGNTALTFARERHAFASGDVQRNKNQVKVLNAISDKLLSGTTLLHYTSIMDAIQDSFTTDMDISSLVSLQSQISMDKDYNGWNIMSFGVIGTPGGPYQTCTFTGTRLSVLMQNEDSIARASDLIQMAINGETADNIQTKIKTYNNEQK